MINKTQPILVTGASGLVGSYLLLYLVEQGHTNIRALYRKSSNLSLLGDARNNIEWVEGDITHYYEVEDAMRGMEKVYHCAAMVSYDDRDYQSIMQTNVGGTENVVNAALYLNTGKLVHVSSTAAIGKNKSGVPNDENSKWSQQSGLSTYAISKYLSEQVVWRGWAEGLNVGIVNPSVIIGAADWSRSSPALFKQIDGGLKFYPKGSNGFVDVRDVVTFMYRLMESDLNAERYILCAENMPFRTYFEKIAAHLEKPAPSIAVNPLLREIAWRLEWIKSRLTRKKVVITKETARLSAQQQYFDNSKSLRMTGFQYRKVYRSIAETAEMYKRSKIDGKIEPLPFA